MNDYDNNETTALARVPQAGMTLRQDATGGQELAVSGEMNQAQIIAEARARIEAEHILAKRFPRDLDLARTKLLADCRRPRFAEKARYRKPQGKKKNEENGRWEQNYAEGPSIRFVEAAIRAMGNLTQEARTVYDDIDRRKILVIVRDLESNSAMSAEIVVEKTVERRDAKGRDVVGSRLNSYGDTVYIVRATEDELTAKQAALVSKAIRTVGLRLIPADLVEESMDMAIATQAKADAQDPDAARKRLVDAFVSIGVKPDALKQYLGHDIAASSPAEMLELRAIYAGIHSGETSWKEVMDSLQEPEEERKGPTVVDRLKDKLKEKGKKAAPRRDSKSQQTLIDSETGEVSDVPEEQTKPMREPGEDI